MGWKKSVITIFPTLLVVLSLASKTVPFPLRLTFNKTTNGLTEQRQNIHSTPIIVAAVGKKYVMNGSCCKLQVVLA